LPTVEGMLPINFSLKRIFKLACLGVSLFLFAASPYFSQQTLVETALVVNIEVPVRVFDGRGNFVNDLTIDDFEVYEDGDRQKIDAVYLIKKNLIHRKEERKSLKPVTSRTFFLIFEIADYTPRLGLAIDDFVDNVLLPQDKLIAVTPQKTYRLKEMSIEVKRREEVAEELKELLRRDTTMGASEYRSALRDLQELARTITGFLLSDESGLSSAAGEVSIEIERLEPLIIQYASYLQKLEVLRQVDELKLIDFAHYLKSQEGQKYVFLFYQREFIPQIEEKVWLQVAGLYQSVGGIDLKQLTADILDLYKRDVSVDVERVKRAFADASTSVHFLYITEPPPNIAGVTFEERTSDIFAPFVEMARASGGFYESSYNPRYLFQNALRAAENYYLLYYSPRKPIGEGEFRNIRVKVKKPGLRVIHRLGYFAY